MTEAKALALVNEIEVERYSVTRMQEIRRKAYIVDEALCRVIEREEATAAELRELKERFSEVARKVDEVLASRGYRPDGVCRHALAPFILPAPDPLVEVLKEADAPSLGDDGYEAMADRVHAAMQARGYEWRKIGEAGE